MPPIPHSPIFGQLQIHSCGFEGKDLLIKKDPSSSGHFNFFGDGHRKIHAIRRRSRKVVYRRIDGSKISRLAQERRKEDGGDRGLGASGAWCDEEGI